MTQDGCESVSPEEKMAVEIDDMSTKAVPFLLRAES